MVVFARRNKLIFPPLPVDNKYKQSTCNKSVGNLQQTCHQQAVASHANAFRLSICMARNDGHINILPYPIICITLNMTYSVIVNYIPRCLKSQNENCVVCLQFALIATRRSKLSNVLKVIFAWIKFIPFLHFPYW